MDEAPRKVAASVRGWDLYVAGLVAILGLSTWARVGSSVWMVHLAVAAAWYFIIGRVALRGGHPRWEIVYFAGMAALIGWSEATTWRLSLLLAMVLPMVAWVFWPSRRKALAWSITIVMAHVAGTVYYVIWGYGAFWDWGTRLINLVLVPAAVFVAVVLMGTWGSDTFHWGRNRLSLVDELRQSQDQALALERAAAIADEHARLAQEVHDTIAQDLAGVRMLVAQARRQEDARASPGSSSGDAPPGSVGATLGLIAEAVDTVVTETRDLIAATTPAPVGSAFKDTVLRITQRFVSDTGIALDASVTRERLPRVTEVVFVRCIQEALSTIWYHARATHVWLTIEVVGEEALLTVRDNGVALTPGARERLGVPGMTERVTQAGGRFAVESPGPSLGVTMRVAMPARAGSER